MCPPNGCLLFFFSHKKFLKIFPKPYCGGMEKFTPRSEAQMSRGSREVKWADPIYLR